MSFAEPSHARTLLLLTYETDRALREGRLGAEEWFAFVSDLESLARKIELRAPPARLQNKQATVKQATAKQATAEGRVLSFPHSASVQER